MLAAGHTAPTLVQPQRGAARGGSRSSSSWAHSSRSSWRAGGWSRAAVQQRSSRLSSSSSVQAAAAAGPTQRLALHLGETTIEVPFSKQQAATLDAALSKLLQTFADKQAATRPQRWDALELCWCGDAEAGPGMERVELFCNPNSFKTAFDAKLLISVAAAGGLRVACEGRLSAVKADVDAFLAETA